MADLVITAANVLPGTAAPINNSYTAGAAITAGQAVYLLAGTPNVLMPAKCSGSAAQAGILGIALNSASIGQPVAVQVGGKITIGATVVVGGLYILSATAGGGFICPFADIATTNLVTIIGIADTATTITLGFSSTGIAHA